MPAYKKGEIYKILNNIDADVYIGSTCDTLSRRTSKHKTFAKINHHSLIYRHMVQVSVEHCLY